MQTIVHPATGEPTQVVESLEDPDLDVAMPHLLLTGEPPCPICAQPVLGYESFTGLAYVSDHGGPFGGPGTYLVAGGEDLPAGVQYDRVQGIPWLSNIEMKPCGHRLATESYKLYRVGQKAFHIEGVEWVNPL